MRDQEIQFEAFDEINEAERSDTLPSAEKKPTRSFTVGEIVGAWLCWLAGYGLMRTAPVLDRPFAGFCMAILLLGATVAVLRRRKEPFRIQSAAALAVGAMIALSLITGSSVLLRFPSYLLALGAAAYGLVAGTGRTMEQGWSELIVGDFFRALFVLPFASFGRFRDALAAMKLKKGGKVIGSVLLGIVAAVIPLGLIYSLLSFDADFVRLFHSIFSISLEELFSHLLHAALGLPVGMYLFGLYVSCADGVRRDDGAAERRAARREKAKLLPVVTVCVVIAVIAGMYVIFFLSQKAHYLSAFRGVLPEETTYAEYARNGFFELCTVSALNLFILALCAVLTRRERPAAKTALKVCTLVLSFMTLGLLGTAASKMVLYIRAYGLTPMRVYASWFELLLALLLILVIVRQFAPKLKLIPAAVVLTAVLYAAIALPNVGGMIAKYNVDRYLSGSLPTLDAEMLRYDIGEAAVPQMIRVREYLDGRDRTAKETQLRLELTEGIRQLAASYYDESLFAFTFPHREADEALRDAGYVRVVNGQVRFYDP